MFSRADWTLFRNLSTLSQKAGVPVKQLRRVVVKELVDNALDASGNVELGKTSDNTYWVQDRGPGIPGTAADIARLFSVNRPLTSTKIVRLPARGALGNGLRVVVGTVLASGGTLEVCTRGRKYKLQPLDDGSTRVLSEEPDSYGGPGTRTRISVTLPEGIPADDGDLSLGKLAKGFSFAKTYRGKSSPFWYDSDSFHELMQAAGETPAVGLIEFFDGYGTGKGEKLPGGVVAGREWPQTCSAFDRSQSVELLKVLRDGAVPVKPTAIGQVGNPHDMPYAREQGVLEIKPGRGGVSAELPFTVEAWAVAREDSEDDAIIAYVNGTPIVGEMRVQRHKPTKIAVFGCGLRHYVERVSSRKSLIQLNVTIPYMPITTDGKEPDFERILDQIAKVISRATKKLKSAIKKRDNPNTITDIIRGRIAAAARKASGEGRYRFSIRQLYYAVRPYVLSGGYPELAYNHFCKTVTDYEAESGEIVGMYRDPRGTLYHPHTGESIPVGTLAVEKYKRPAWTFNKILYVEKEGLVATLIADRWPERNDCAILSSKGFASRAVRDVLDLLGDTGEDLTFYCIHDADASGTLIYQSLTGETRARAARKVQIKNLGLDPWEAVSNGLQIETFATKGNRSMPVASYVRHADEPAPDGSDSWEEWLQTNRVELNAMTSPEFIAWLDGKMVEAGVEQKVIPPQTVLRRRLEAETGEAVRRAEAARILKEADIDSIVADRMAALRGRLDAVDPGEIVSEHLGAHPVQQWTVPLSQLAETLTVESAPQFP